MKVTSGEYAEPGLESRVHAELLALRKLRGGVTVEALAQSPVVCQLLGAGDPFVAFTRLQHEVLGSNLDIAIQAAAASLGFSSNGETHLERLSDFGRDAGLDQRQVRRHSDKGIDVLARLISTNWTNETVPQLSVTIEYIEGECWQLFVMTQCFHVVEMSDPEISVFVGDTRIEESPVWMNGENDVWNNLRTERPIRVEDVDEETSIAIVWRGEIWPKFNVQWLSWSPLMSVETLGNKLFLRLHPSRK